MFLSNTSNFETDMTPTGTISPSESRPGINGNEGVLNSLQVSRIEAPPSDVIQRSPMVRRTWVQFLVESYQRLEKWYLCHLP